MAKSRIRGVAAESLSDLWKKLLSHPHLVTPARVKKLLSGYLVTPSETGVSGRILRRCYAGVNFDSPGSGLTNDAVAADPEIADPRVT